MTIGQRILYFIEACYQTQKNFAEETGINTIALNRYINDKNTPGVDALIKMKDAGMSVDWLIEGEGNMFAGNITGRNLQMSLHEQKSLNRNSPYDRILNWIIEHYESLENYAVCMNLDFQELYDVLYNDMISDPTLIQNLKKAGCNITWISTGTGSKYADNIAGMILKSKHEVIHPESPEGRKLKDKIFEIMQKEPQDKLLSMIREYMENGGKSKEDK